MPEWDEATFDVWWDHAGYKGCLERSLARDVFWYGYVACQLAAQQAHEAAAQEPRIVGRVVQHGPISMKVEGDDE